MSAIITKPVRGRIVIYRLPYAMLRDPSRPVSHRSVVHFKSLVSVFCLFLPFDWPVFLPEAAFEMLAKRQINKLREPALECAERV